MPTPTVKMLYSVGVHVSLPPRSVPDSINSEATTTSRVFFCWSCATSTSNAAFSLIQRSIISMSLASSSTFAHASLLRGGR
jgi:hypothetical protein